METASIIDDYFDAWNAHDGTKLGGLFIPEGRFADPSASLELGPFDLQALIDSLSARFADFHFEADSRVVEGDRVVAQWILTGTNDGSIRTGIAPTHRRLHLRGVDAMQLFEGRIVRVKRYFDQHELHEQLGLQVLVEPIQQGAAHYGYSLHASSGNRSVPGIVALTWIMGRDNAERERIRDHSSQIVGDFLKEPGFIGIITGFAGNRGFTCTAWQDEEALHRALEQQHAKAKQEFRSSGLSPAVWTSVWKPHRINRLWVRCVACDDPNDVSGARTVCERCGATLPERPGYW